jgi:hypothetical protein
MRGKIGEVQLASGLYGHTYTQKSGTSLVHCTLRETRGSQPTLHQRWDAMHRNVAIILA